MSRNDSDTLEYIDHGGRVESVDMQSRALTVRIDDEHDCGGCPAAKLCGAASGSKTTVVPVRHPESFAVGDRVRLSGTERMHRRAIMLATVFPCLALIAIMVMIFVITGNQLWAALGGIASMLVFYLALYLARNKIEHEFGFEVEKL